MAREGRAFGIAIAIGTQFPVDIPDDLAGSLETQIFLSNSEARHQAATVRKLCSSTSTIEGQRLWQKAASLGQLQGFIRNQHYKPYRLITVYPHYLRRADIEAGNLTQRCRATRRVATGTCRASSETEFDRAQPLGAGLRG